MDLVPSNLRALGHFLEHTVLILLQLSVQTTAVRELFLSRFANPQSRAGVPASAVAVDDSLGFAAASEWRCHVFARTMDDGRLPVALLDGLPERGNLFLDDIFERTIGVAH